MSSLTPVELLRLGLKGALVREDAELLLIAIPAVYQVVWLHWGIGERAARLSHRLHLPLVHAPIPATALGQPKGYLGAWAKEIWTADADLAWYEGKLRMVLSKPEGKAIRCQGPRWEALPQRLVGHLSA